PDSGEYVWHYQEIPAETWDYTATQHIMLADIEWYGRQRKVLLHAPKAGFFYIIDRAGGELLSAEPFAKKVNWASHYDMKTGRPVEIAGADYKDAPYNVYPIGIGAHNWHPMSYSPGTGLVYIPAQHTGGELAQEADFKPTARHWNLGNKSPTPTRNLQLNQTMLKTLMYGYLLAWDPVKQESIWEVKHPLLSNGGTLTTAGNLVFQGTLDGRFLAVNARTGTQLFRFNAQNGIVGSPISYAVNDEQYIAVPVARGGGLSYVTGIAHDGPSAPGRILAFKLSGAAQLPELEEERFPDPPSATEASDKFIDKGNALYHRFCFRCHGVGAVSDGSLPDLRYLDPIWHANFNKVVLEGMRENVGMPRFNDVLNEKDSAAVQAYIIDQAWEAHRQRNGSKLWNAVKQKAYDAMAWVVQMVL
ncbi:MAG: c-type cytochrome, partial [Pseudomonadales bacterium]